MQIKPFGQNILVKPIEKKSVMVTDNNPLCEYGTVVAVGNDVQHIKVGDTIGYTVWGVNKLEIQDESHYFILEDSRFLLGTIALPEQLVA